MPKAAVIDRIYTPSNGVSHFPYPAWFSELIEHETPNLEPITLFPDSRFLLSHLRLMLTAQYRESDIVLEGTYETWFEEVDKWDNYVVPITARLSSSHISLDDEMLASGYLGTSAILPLLKTLNHSFLPFVGSLDFVAPRYILMGMGLSGMIGIDEGLKSARTLTPCIYSLNFVYPGMPEDVTSVHLIDFAATYRQPRLFFK